MARGKNFGIVEVRFRGIATTRLHPATPLRTNEVAFLSIYLGRVRVEDISPKVDVCWLVVAIFLGMEKEVVLQATISPYKNWKEQSLKVVV